MASSVIKKNDGLLVKKVTKTVIFVLGDNTYNLSPESVTGYTFVSSIFVGISSITQWTNGISNIIPHVDGTHVAVTTTRADTFDISFLQFYVKSN